MFSLHRKRISFFIIILSITFSLSCTSGMHAHQNTGWKLQWQDEFNYADVPDSNKWSYDVGGDGWWNKELQYYTNKRKENARVENGQLIIEARKEDFEENKYTSARLVTKGKADFKYGKIELRAKLPKGRGIWPAFWLLSSQDPRIWPDDGEIDIMEHVGYKQGEITGATHVKKNANGTDILSKASTIMIPDAAENFHTYTLIWSPEKLEWYVDHKLFHHFDKDNRPSYQWPFDKEFYILLNIAIGGTWGGKEGIDDTIFPQKIHLDYVRVYKKVNKY